MPDGRIGNVVWKREIRDDVKDTEPHGSVDLGKGIIVSCNAFFAQFGANSVGADALFETATKLGISVAHPNTAAKLHEFLPQASYGQGQVVASPFQMARVAATIANGGSAPQGRWIVDETNQRVQPPEVLLPPEARESTRGIHAWRRNIRDRAECSADRLSQSPEKPERQDWRRTRRTPGSSDSRPTEANRRRKSLSPFS